MTRKDTPAARVRGLRLLFAAVIVLLFAVATGDQVMFGNRIFPGVHVGPVDVGRMTADAASRELSERLSTVSTLTVRWPGGERTVRISGDSLRIDTAGAASQAFATGRAGNLFSRLATRWRAARDGLILPVESQPTGPAMEALQRASQDIYRPAGDAHFALNRRGSLVIVPGKDGRVLDKRTAAEMLADTVLARGATVELRVKSTPPAVTTPLASAFASVASRWAAAGVHLKIGRTHVVLRPEQIVAAATVSDRRLIISPSALSRRFGPAAGNFARKPRSATFTVARDRVYIIPDDPGRAVDWAGTARRLVAALNSGRRSLPAEIRSVPADLTRADLAALGIHRLLSSFTTRFRLGADGRDINIALSARAVRGKVLAVGQIFSLNRATGPRNARTGYKEALVFQNGKVVPGIGGGVCQVSSTLYEAALFADLRIVERSSHSMAVTYLPPGRDATTFYPTVDLKFQNTTLAPILLWSAVKRDKLTMQVYGSGRRPKVTIKTVVRKTIPPKQTIVYTSSLPRGVRQIQSVGRPGYIVTSYRLIWQGNRVAQRELLSTDTYRPRNWVIESGM